MIPMLTTKTVPPLPNFETIIMFEKKTIETRITDGLQKGEPCHEEIPFQYSSETVACGEC